MKTKTTFDDMVAAMDAFFFVEDGLQSAAYYAVAKEANKDSIDAAMNLIRDAGKDMANIEIMRARYRSLINFGHKQRGAAWISCMRAYLNRCWININGWQP